MMSSKLARPVPQARGSAGIECIKTKLRAAFQDRPGQLFGIHASEKQMGMHTGQQLLFVHAWFSPSMRSSHAIHARVYRHLVAFSSTTVGRIMVEHALRCQEERGHGSRG